MGTPETENFAGQEQLGKTSTDVAETSPLIATPKTTVSRRGFLKLAALGAASILLSPTSTSAEELDPPPTAEKKEKLRPKKL